MNNFLSKFYSNLPSSLHSSLFACQNLCFFFFLFFTAFGLGSDGKNSIEKPQNFNFDKTHSSLYRSVKYEFTTRIMEQHMKLVHQSCMKIVKSWKIWLLFRFCQSSTYDLLHLLHLLEVRDLEILFHLPSKL